MRCPRIRAPSWTSIGVIVSLIISGYTLFLTFFRPANIVVEVGELIGFGYEIGDQAPYLVIPIIISNEGARTGLMQSMGVFFSQPDQDSTRGSLLKWRSFAAYNSDFVFTPTHRAVAFPVRGRTSEFRLVIFDLGPGLSKWVPQQRTYSFDLVVWTHGDMEPDAVPAHFQITFSAADSTTLSNYLTQKRGLIRWIQRDEWTKWRTGRLPPEQIEQIRRLEHRSA